MADLSSLEIMPDKEKRLRENIAFLLEVVDPILRADISRAQGDSLLAGYYEPIRFTYDIQIRLLAIKGEIENG